MLCDSPKLLEEASLWGGHRIHTVLYTQGVKLPVYDDCTAPEIQVTESVMESVSPMKTPQGVVFSCAAPTLRLPGELKREPERYLTWRQCLVLDGVQDPGNVGTLWRTADAFGADGLLLLPGCADPWNPKTVRATMGACFRLPLWETELEPRAQRLEAAALPLYAAALGPDTADLRQADLRRAAVVIGSEGQGVSEAVLARCQGRLKIPMRERCESLNAAAAGAVVLWEMGQREG